MLGTAKGKYQSGRSRERGPRCSYLLAALVRTTHTSSAPAQGRGRTGKPCSVVDGAAQLRAVRGCSALRRGGWSMPGSTGLLPGARPSKSRGRRAQSRRRNGSDRRMSLSLLSHARAVLEGTCRLASASLAAHASHSPSPARSSHDPVQPAVQRPRAPVEYSSTPVPSGALLAPAPVLPSTHLAADSNPEHAQAERVEPPIAALAPAQSLPNTSDAASTLPVPVPADPVPNQAEHKPTMTATDFDGSDDAFTANSAPSVQLRQPVRTHGDCFPALLLLTSLSRRLDQ